MFGAGFGGQEIIVILILVLVLFGAKRIPEIMRGFGQGLREFKEASQKAMNEIDEATSVDTKPAPRKPKPSSPPKGETADEAALPEDMPKVEPE